MKTSRILKSFRCMVPKSLHQAKTLHDKFSNLPQSTMIVKYMAEPDRGLACRPARPGSLSSHKPLLQY
jgi:hypothetical protein